MQKTYQEPTIVIEEVKQNELKLVFRYDTDRLMIRNRCAYISGGISEYWDTDKNEPAFNEAEQRFNGIGFQSVNPHKLYTDEEKKTHTWYDFMLTDTPALLKCGIIVMLPNWLRSDGACIEYLNAAFHGIPAVDSVSYKTVFLTSEEKKQLSSKIIYLLEKNEVKILQETI